MKKDWDWDSDDPWVPGPWSNASIVLINENVLQHHAPFGCVTILPLILLLLPTIHRMIPILVLLWMTTKIQTTKIQTTTRTTVLFQRVDPQNQKGNQ